MDGGRVVGLLNRRDVDRAMSHGMVRQMVRQIMEAGEITVRPSDSIEVVQQLMMRTGWGQIPVVDDNGKLLGIVTRTDLITRWGQRADTTRRDEMIQRMQAAMSPGMWLLLQAIAREAQNRRVGVYIVGGFVRDLLLNIPDHHDVDLVVEDNAIELVRAIQQAYGGDMRSHAQFGTAKWLPDEASRRALNVDFARGRDGPPLSILCRRAQEFYEAPTALPTVQRSSIKPDLDRRDFTINTLAIRLAPEPSGELLDFYGGEQDLQRRRDPRAAQPEFCR